MDNSFKLWNTYDAKRKDGTVVKLRFQDIHPAQRKAAIEMRLKYITKDEIFHKAAEMDKNEKAIEEYRNILNENSPDKHVTVCCVDDGTEYGGEIAGLSTMGFTNNADTVDCNKLSCDTKEMRTLISIIHTAKGYTDLHTKFDSHYEGNGIIVHPNYRGLGIASEFVRLRLEQCQEFNVPMTAAWMTARGTQEAAKKNGWKTDVEIKAEDLGRKCGVQFEDKTIVLKYMYKTTNEIHSNGFSH